MAGTANGAPSERSESRDTNLMPFVYILLGPSSGDYLIRSCQFVNTRIV